MVKAINMVFSRPIWSEIQPNSGREMPFMTRSSISANGRAAMVTKYRFDLEVLHAEILRDDAELGDGHQAAGHGADEHRGHHPEHRGAQRFRQRVVATALAELAGGRHFAGPSAAPAGTMAATKMMPPCMQAEEQEGLWTAPLVASMVAIGRMVRAEPAPIATGGEADGEAAA